MKKERYFKENILIIVFSILFGFSLLMIFIQEISLQETITGHATEIYTVSNVSISSFLSIDMSPNLTAGILFGTVSNLPATNVNATHNYDSGESPPNQSSMFLNVSLDSNTAVDFCIKANDDLVDSVGGNRIGIDNETYSNSSVNNLTFPSLSNEKSINHSYVKSAINVEKGDNVYFRFWLDIPAATPAGSYNNTIYFKGVQNGSSCGS
ncbi:MAG: hypothetical protein QXW97_01780 [Candidatus Pacearchaeota archaeon]